MDLKFSFGGAVPDHSHGAAPSGISLPLTSVTPAASSASDLMVVVTRTDEGIRAEVQTGAKVVYTSADVAAADEGELPKATRSGIARAVAGLEGPLAEQVSVIELTSALATPAVFALLEIDASAPAVTQALQRRIGVATGTLIRVSA